MYFYVLSREKIIHCRCKGKLFFEVELQCFSKRVDSGFLLFVLIDQAVDYIFNDSFPLDYLL
jgi:hypothetical protein